MIGPRPPGYWIESGGSGRIILQETTPQERWDVSTGWQWVGWEEGETVDACVVVSVSVSDMFELHFLFCYAHLYLLKQNIAVTA